MPEWFWALFFGIAVLIVGWEMLALMDKEKQIPTWSRMIWILQEKYPRFKYIVAVLVVLIVFGFGAWLLIHFWIGLPELR